MIENCPDPDAQWQEIARVAYDIARAALDEQHAAVRDLRARTGALLSSPHPQRDPATEAYRRLAETRDGISATNESHIEVLGQVFTLASAAIVFEVLLWGLQLALP
jgi:hypothetical protein